MSAEPFTPAPISSSDMSFEELLDAAPEPAPGEVEAAVHAQLGTGPDLRRQRHGLPDVSGLRAEMEL